MTLASRFETNRPHLYGQNGRNGILAELSSCNAEHLIISCMDLKPSLFSLFGFSQGEMLNLRSAGPLIPPYDTQCSASQLYQENLTLAVNDLKIKSISLLGHSGCSTASKLSQNLYSSGDIPWIKKMSGQILQTALNECGGDQDQACLSKEIEKQIIIHGIKNLFDYPVIMQGIREFRLTVEGLQFDMDNGRIFKLNTDGKTFFFDIVAGPTELSHDCGCAHKESISAA